LELFKNILGSLGRLWLGILLIIVVSVILFITFKFGYIAGAAITLIPFGLIFFVVFINNPFWGFIAVFIANYYIQGLTRYIPSLPSGILMDGLLGITIVSIILHQFKTRYRYSWRSAYNVLTLMAFIWLLYCVFLLLVPDASPLGWATAARGIGIYFIVITILVSVLVKDFKDLHTILNIWAVLSLTAVLKALIQQYLGFDSAESRWLYVEGASRTHIIYSGIRYFSFFSDAANFGSGIALSGVVFGIAALGEKRLGYKVFYAVTCLASMYGMIISGTRGSLMVPFVGFTLYTILSKRFKSTILAIFAILSVFVFLKYTNYGQGNSYVRRMRSIFNAAEDASLQVRMANQDKLRVYMADRHFGVGIGMSRGRAETYQPNAFVSKIPSDSWYVLIWVETGIVGLILHLLILLSVPAYGAYLILFKLRDPTLRGIVSAMVCGISGLYVSSYTIEILGQFPTGFILYTCMTVIFISPKFDRELQEKNLKLEANNG
jgi:hypothetical protein